MNYFIDLDPCYDFLMMNNYQNRNFPLNNV